MVVYFLRGIASSISMLGISSLIGYMRPHFSQTSPSPESG